MTLTCCSSMASFAPSCSQWASSLHLVPRTGGGWRSTGDYRKLNCIMVPDRYPIPRIEDLLRSLHGSRYFTKLDLNRAYYQVPDTPEDIPKMAVTTPFGLFEFVGMPLGLRNATQTFQRHTDNLFLDLPFVRVYIDDLLIASPNLEEHLRPYKLLSSSNSQAGSNRGTAHSSFVGEHSTPSTRHRTPADESLYSC